LLGFLLRRRAHAPRRPGRPTIPTVQPTPPKGGFVTYRLDPRLLKGLEAAGFTEPRPIQHQTIPAAMLGRDVLGLAQTGTGKTAAFLLPLMSRLLERPPQAESRARGFRPPRPIRALIVAPTRELANQIEAELQLLGRFTGLRSTAIYGGVTQARQVRALRAGVDIVIACPGRLLDLLSQGEVQLSSVESLVLDEADQMFDMGFLPSIRRILAALPPRRQSLLFSATMPKEVRKLADDLLNQPTVVELAHSAPAATVEHALYPVAEDHKQALLMHLLRQPELTGAIVFTRTKHRAKRLAERLAKLGQRAASLQGNLSQAQRDRAMQGFRDGSIRVLVATDIAARGLDVDSVSHVINFDVPISAEAYTHRIGRTGRSGRAGQALTFVTRADRDGIKDIERGLRQSLRVASLDESAQAALAAGLPAASEAGLERPRRAAGPAGARRGSTGRERPAKATAGERVERRPGRGARGEAAAASGTRAKGREAGVGPRRAGPALGAPQQAQAARRGPGSEASEVPFGLNVAPAAGDSRPGPRATRPEPAAEAASEPARGHRRQRAAPGGGRGKFEGQGRRRAR
jgi:ATP-dependent RNA helicase RhlE